MNLPEILTILLGLLLALIIVDGFRRALRSRNEGIKVELMSPESIEEVLQDSEEYFDHQENELETEIFDEPHDEEIHSEEIKETISEVEQHNLVIINLSSQNDVFSKESIIANYESLNIRHEEQGHLSILDLSLIHI